MSLTRRWGRQDEFAAIIDAAAARWNVPPGLVYAIAGVESGFTPDARSPSGSLGLLQLTTDTATGLGYSGAPDGLLDPTMNVELGTRLLAQLLDRLGGNAANVASAYNGGVRPELGFGQPAGHDGRVCLTWADPQKSRCLQWHTFRTGEYGNQQYVNDVLGAYGYFAQYLAERDGTPAPATVPAPAGEPDGSGTGSKVLAGLAIGAGLFGLLKLLRIF